MSQSWPLVPLGEVLKPVTRPEPVKPEVTYNILGAHWYAAGLYTKEITTGAGIQATNLYRVEEGDFVYNRLFAWKGSFAVANKENAGCYVSNEFPCFRPNPDRLDARFLWRYFSRSLTWDEALALSTGGTPTSRNRLKEDKLLAFRIPLPPLQEQRRIVARIEVLAAKIEEARDLRRAATDEAELISKSATDAMLGSASWQEVPLGSILRENSLNGLAARPSPTPPGIPILRISAATSRSNGVIDESDFKYLDVSEPEATKYALEVGDLLACRFNGNLHYVGRFALYERRLVGPRLYPDKLIRFRISRERGLPQYVCLAMNSERCRRVIESMCATTAGNLGISAGDLKTVPLPLPPIVEQRRIVAHLESVQVKVDALRRLQAETAAELDALLPSILDKAFKGGL